MARLEELPMDRLLGWVRMTHTLMLLPISLGTTGNEKLSKPTTPRCQHICGKSIYWMVAETKNWMKISWGKSENCLLGLGAICYAGGNDM